MDVISYSKAKKAQQTADSVQEQLNQAIRDGDQLAETQQARVDDEGVAHPTLQARLNSDANKHKLLTDRVADVEEELSLQDRQTQTLKHGLNVINGEVGSPLDVEMYGNTLVPLGNSVLQEGKRYVLADRKYKVKFADGVTHNGIAKFMGQSERPSIIRVANFEGKVAGSDVENPHRISYMPGIVQTLPTPTQLTSENNQGHYSSAAHLDTSIFSNPKSTEGSFAHTAFSFNIIEEVERKIGKIPKTTLAEKVQWCKDNIARLVCNWWGFGSSAGGNKANLCTWKVIDSAWDSVPTSATSNVVTKLYTTKSDINNRVDSNGFAHFLAYADPSNGTTPSVINTDYVELEIELKPNADFHNPKVPLYEVTQDEYNKILTDWDASEVINRFPSVEGVQHVVNPVLSVSGGNLLNGYDLKPYLQTGGIEFDGITLKYRRLMPSSYSGAVINVPTIVGEQYTLSFNLVDGFPRVRLDGSDFIREGSEGTFTATKELTEIVFTKGAQSTADEVISHIMLTVGSESKTHTPYNPSHLYAETILAGIGNNRDTLFKQDGVWYKRKVWESVVLDGSLNWLNDGTYSSFKRARLDLANVGLGLAALSSETVVKYNGEKLTRRVDWDKGDLVYINATSFYISIPNTDTGWAEDYTPTTQDIKNYFNANPYYLTYQLATPVIEPITVEGDLSIQGMAQVEVGEGVIVREKANPILHQGNYHINNESENNNLFESKLKNRLLKFVGIYKNNVDDTSNWNINSTNAYGNVKAFIPESDFDPTAEYTVTYTVLDKHQITSNLTDVKATYNQSLKSAFNDVVAKQSDLATDISINNRSIIDLYVRVKALEGI